MDTTLMLLLIALLGLHSFVLWRLHAQVEDLRLDVQEIHANTQEAYSVLVDMAMEDAAGNAEWAFDITETNGAVHE